MAPPIRLSADEHAALTAALKDPARFHSDGREVTIACAMTAVLGAPLVVVLANLGLSSWRLYMPGVSPLRALLAPLSTLHMAPELLGAFALSGVIVGAAVYGVRTYGRHGHLLLPFGVARIRGSVKALIRLEEIASLTITQRRRPQYKVVTDELEVKATDGRAILLFGFAAGARKQQIEADMRARTLALPQAGAPPQ